MGLGVVPELAVLPEVDLPPPSAELVLIRTFVAAYLATCHLKPGRRAKAFIRAAADMLESEESMSHINAIRSSPAERQCAITRRQAVAMFRRYVPTFVAAGLMDAENDA
jgi:hypothetical protein